jgi:hypothetical protein
VDSGAVDQAQLPEARACTICGVVREDVSEVSFYSADHQKRTEPLCADCKTRHLVRRRRSRRRQISRGNRAAEIAGMVLVGVGIVALLVVIVGTIASRL